MEEDQPSIEFVPTPRDFPGFSMPSSVPPGMRLELSRSRILDGHDQTFQAWMNTLNERYEECEATLSGQRAAFEATFRHVEADGSVWIYHLSLVGEDGGGLNEQQEIDAVHQGYARKAKMAGWEELEPKFLLMPDHLRTSMEHWARHGTTAE
ncbi:DUF6176 family protein [Glutamicibacter halophytocola]|uniref:DUF6176 family protein n=1 Tax=Glutamicibacter halophytocola TaxID=1933880 RepID=UPI0020A65DF6|nr:DUF6176 family protein [Glutamicibacter halophytocola]